MGINKLAKTCVQGTFFGNRVRATIITLYDTGIWGLESCDLERADINLADGSIFVKVGTGCKPRFACMGSRICKVVSAYLKYCHYQSLNCG